MATDLPPSTVRTALRQLVDAGLVVTRPKVTDPTTTVYTLDLEDIPDYSEE